MSDNSSSHDSRAHDEYRNQIAYLEAMFRVSSPASRAPYPEFQMPSERYQYTNKESGKVNLGLSFGAASKDGDDTAQTIGPWSTNKPVIDIDFSILTVPAAAPEPKATTKQLVRRLLSPPPHAFVHGVLSIQWVISAVGQAHFECRDGDERFVLTQDSALRKEGSALGLPAVYLEWLCGDDPNDSAAEQGRWLTPAFFENEVDREESE